MDTLPEIGTNDDHVYFLVQSVPIYNTTKIMTIIMILTVHEVFRINPEVKQKFSGAEIWTKGYSVNTISKFWRRGTRAKYVNEYGVEQQYHKLYMSIQLALF